VAAALLDIPAGRCRTMPGAMCPRLTHPAPTTHLPSPRTPRCTPPVYWFFAAKLLDRMSKGIREAPTKAVMNELAKESGDAPDAAYGGAQRTRRAAGARPPLQWGRLGRGSQGQAWQLGHLEAQQLPVYCWPSSAAAGAARGKHSCVGLRRGGGAIKSTHLRPPMR
jgi:hypothetical protein